MAKYIVLLDFTDQGVRDIKDSPKRTDAFAELARRADVKLEDVYWTSGGHDGVVVLDSPDDAATARLTLSLGRMGNVRTQTLRAFGRPEMESILADVE